MTDRIVTAIERSVDWQPIWASRLLGCTVGLLRLFEWASLSSGFAYDFGGKPFSYRDRLSVAFLMWRVRYWIKEKP